MGAKNYTDFKKGEKMRKRILSLCYTLGWVKFCDIKGRNFVDYESLNVWMNNRSYLHKNLNYYTYDELPRLVTQFETMTKRYLKSV